MSERFGVNHDNLRLYPVGAAEVINGQVAVETAPDKGRFRFLKKLGYALFAGIVTGLVAFGIGELFFAAMGTPADISHVLSVGAGLVLGTAASIYSLRS